MYFYGRAIMKNNLFWFVLLGMGLGLCGGIFFPNEMLSLRWIGQLFINLLMLIALPLVFSALVSAITSIGHIKRLGSIGLYTIAYIFLSVSFAVCIGLILINIFKPGVNVPPQLILANATDIPDVTAMDFTSFLLSIFPPNIIHAAAKSEMVTVILFSLVFSIACISVGESGKPVIEFFNGLRNIFVKMIVWLMTISPLGIFSLLGAAIADASIKGRLFDSIQGMSFFIIVFIMGLFLQVLWQFAVIKWITRRNATFFLRNASSAMLTAFATSSSIATLPVALLVAKNQNINDDVARFVLPFATTINLAGTAMYEAVSTLFFCQILGIHLSLFSQIGVFIISIMAGIGATGIPEGGIVTMVMVLRSMAIPTSAITFLLPFDRILDRCRTMVNVWGDLVCAAVVDHYRKKQCDRSKALNASVESYVTTPLLTQKHNKRTANF